MQGFVIKIRVCERVLSEIPPVSHSVIASECFDLDNDDLHLVESLDTVVGPSERSIFRKGKFFMVKFRSSQNLGHYITNHFYSKF